MIAGRLRARVRATMIAGLLALTALTAPAAHAATYPSSMDALGDSMTRGFNTYCPFAWTDCVNNSWATGTSATVNSYAARLTKLNPGLSGHVFNDALTGAKMADLPRQAGLAVSHGVGLVTILMGNNDACSGANGGTSVASLKSDFQTAMTKLVTGLPNAAIRVSSVPDAYQLWQLFHNNSTATANWATWNECNNLLANPTSTAPADVARRAAFRQLESDYNAAMGAVCAQYAQCKYDGGAGFNATFQTKHVSTADYFHPSVAGQALIASTEWPAIGY